MSAHARRAVLASVAALVMIASTGIPAAAQRASFPPAPSPAAASPAAPEAASGLMPKTLAVARRQMISAAHPLAVEAGLAILDEGGRAVDAAIAVQLVLNLVEPQSSGIGGGAFLVHHDAGARRTRTYDGRETAPAAARPERFLKADGSPRGFAEAVFGGESVGVPGLVRLMAMAHARHGRLPWARLFAPAIKHAEEGFPVGPRLHALLAGMGAQAFDVTARAYFFAEDGSARPVGHVLKSPAFAATLRAIAEGGADAFYRGPIADGIVKAVAEAPNHRGDLTVADLAGYAARERPAVCVPYRLWRVCGMGPPSSGGVAIAQMLRLLEPGSLGRAPMNPAAVHRIVEAQKLAYADRDRYVGDPDVVAVPVAGLLAPAYIAARRALLPVERASGKAEPGLPPGLEGRRAGRDSTRESVGTSHISVVDARGDAVALTTTIENAFGARLMTGGFLLNNQLTDFAFRPRDASGAPAANAVGPGKRPRSSMAPTVVLDARGRVKAVLGSPGGSRIILYVAKALIGVVDWDLDAQAAIDLPNFGSRNGPLELEAGMAPALLAAHLAARGHPVQMVEMTSGLHVIVRARDGTLQGGADPRREGIVRGR